MGWIERRRDDIESGRKPVMSKAAYRLNWTLSIIPIVIAVVVVIYVVVR
jgi:hypothetical protein